MVLKWMNTPENLLPDSTLYVRIYFAGLLFIFVYNMGAAILRAIGDSKRPLYFLIVCCIVNIILDLVLVLGFKMGVLDKVSSQAADFPAYSSILKPYVS